MKKRIVAAVLAGTLALSLAACGSSTTAGTSADTTAADATAEASTDTAAADTEAADTNEVRTIKAVTGGDTRPYVFVDEDNNPTGYDLEVLKLIFEQLPQYDLEIEVASFDAIFAGLTAGQYQIAVNNFSYNEKRGESYLYSLPYDKISYVFVYAEDGEPVTSFEEAAGKSLEGSAGVSISNAIETWNGENPDKAINLKYSDAGTVLELQHVLDGQNDFQIIDTAMYNAYVEEYGLEGLVATPLSEEDTRRIGNSDYAYYLFPLDEPELREAIDEVLVTLQADGTLTALGQEYQGRDDCAPEDEQMAETLN